MKSFSVLRNISYLILTFIVIACGGGGSDSFSPPDISNTPVALSESNQNDVIDTSSTSTTLTTGSGSIITGVVIESGAGFNPVDFVSGKLLDYVFQGKADASTLPLGVEFNESVNCDSGSMTISGTVSDPNADQLSAGDTFTLSFNNCVDGGTTVTGSVSASVSSGTVVPLCNPFCDNFQMTINFNNLSVTDSGTTASIHGGFNMTHADSTDTVSGSSLYLIATGSEAAHLTNFNISTVTSGSLKTSTVSLTVASTQIDGLINIETADGDPLLQYTYESHPHAGTLIITGKDNSSLTIEHLSSASVQVTLDADGDSVTDDGYPVTVTWTEIDSAVAAN
jgi:hypothetical protein